MYKRRISPEITRISSVRNNLGCLLLIRELFDL